jgi:hypothetical protein
MVLIALQTIQLLSLLPWLTMAGLSVMAFFAPGSSERLEAWLFVLGFWSYPLWLIGAGILSWVLFAFRRPVPAVVVAFVFALPMPVLLGLMLVANAS